jgi:type I site-specific restriction endonuclease
MTEKKVPASLLAVESSIKYNMLSKRCDIVVYGTKGRPLLIVECKAPSVEVGGAVFQQVAMYNFSLKVRYLVVTNGNRTFACEVDHETGAVKFLEDIPDYEVMNI